MKLHVRTWGAPNLPRTAVLVHGIAGASGSWWRVAPALVDHGYFCVAPDLRGHGQSPKPDGQYRIPEMAADLAESVPTTEPDLLIGFSLGGGIALLATYAGLLEPKHLVLADPALAALPHSAAEALLLNAESAPRGVEAILAANSRWHPEDAEERRRQFSTTDWDHMRRILVDAPPWEAHSQLADLLGRVPTLFVLADPSELVSRDQAERIRRILGPDSVVVLPSTSHSLYRDDFEGFMHAVLSRVGGDGP